MSTKEDLSLVVDFLFLKKKKNDYDALPGPELKKREAFDFHLAILLDSHTNCPLGIRTLICISRLGLIKINYYSCLEIVFCISIHFQHKDTFRNCSYIDDSSLNIPN